MSEDTKRLFASARASIIDARGSIMAMPSSREHSLAITKLDEAEMWLEAGGDASRMTFFRSNLKAVLCWPNQANLNYNSKIQ